MGRFGAKLQHFMIGRNGNDALGKFLLLAYLGIFFVNLFVESWVLSLLGIFLAGWELFRFFSKNLYSRRAENAAWIRFWGKVAERFRELGWKIRDAWRKVRIPRVKVKKTARPRTAKAAPKPRTKAPRPDRDHANVACPVCAGTLTVRKIRGERYAMCPHCHNEVRIKI